MTDKPEELEYAKRLATYIWERHQYKNTWSGWKPLDDLMGVLSQIDNMLVGFQFKEAGPEFKTQYKFIHFEKVAEKVKTSVWEVRSNSINNALAIIKWYGAWRQYCFFPLPDCVFNVGCLEDINHFIGQLKEAKE